MITVLFYAPFLINNILETAVLRMELICCQQKKNNNSGQSPETVSKQGYTKQKPAISFTHMFEL